MSIAKETVGLVHKWGSQHWVFTPTLSKNVGELPKKPNSAPTILGSWREDDKTKSTTTHNFVKYKIDNTSCVVGSREMSVRNVSTTTMRHRVRISSTLGNYENKCMQQYSTVINIIKRVVLHVCVPHMLYYYYFSRVQYQTWTFSFFFV